MRSLIIRLRRFRSDSRASMTVEFILVLPLIIWAYAGMYVFWDAFKAKNINVKAAYTISDLVSRADFDISEAYIDRMQQMVEFLNYDRHPVRMRISFVEMRDDGAGNPELALDGSRVRGPAPVAPFDALQQQPFERHTFIEPLEPVVPMMAIGDRAIVVETQLDYSPLLQFRAYPLNPRILSNVVVTRPRLSGNFGFENTAPSG